jgi:hypothetical protein
LRQCAEAKGSNRGDDGSVADTGAQYMESLLISA